MACVCMQYYIIIFKMFFSFKRHIASNMYIKNI